MSEPNKDEKKKRGFLPWLSNLFKGKTPMARGGMGAASGAGRAGVSGVGEAAGLGRTALSGVGRAASGLGSAGSGLSGLFATKAGIVGIVLGGATLAAGIGVLYNFLGPSSKSGMTPQLFQNAYYDEQAQNASLDRSNMRSGSVDGSLDMFKEQAKKDGLALGEEEAAAAAAEENPANASADAAVEPGAVPVANPVPNAPAGPSRLQASGGFGGMSGGGGGGGSSSMANGASAGGKFGSAYKAPVGQGGKTSKMSAKSAQIVGGGKYAVPASKKGAFGQAKFAGKMGNKAAYSADGVGARTSATEAFSGETTGSGDVVPAGGGAGLGQNAAGLSGSDKLKASDPNTDGSSFTPPTPGEPVDVSPWNDLRDDALKYIMIGLGLVILTKILSKFAKTVPWLYYAAIATAIGAMLAGLYVMYIGYKLYKGDPNGNPPWTGQLGLAIPMALAGLVIVIQAWNALCDAAGQSTYTDAKGNVVDTSKGTLTAGKDGAMNFTSGTGSEATTISLNNANPLSSLSGMGLGNIMGGM